MKTFCAQVADKMRESNFLTDEVTTYMNHLCIEKAAMPTLTEYEDLKASVSNFVKGHFNDMPDDLSVLVRAGDEEPAAFTVYK